MKIIAKNVSMSSAEKEIRDAQGANENDVVNCGISSDGTWRKQAHFPE